MPAASYDLIVIEAFSSDAIPTHLITREAVAMYESRLKAHGMIAFHVSSRFFHLPPVVARIAADRGPILVLVTGVVILALVLNVVGNRQVSAAAKATEVRDVANPGRHPFQATAGCTMDPGDNFCFNQFAVPANRLLVIETMSAFITVPVGQTAHADLNVTQQITVGFFMPSTYVATDVSGDRYATMQSLRAYAFPGTNVTAIGTRSADAGSGSAITTISGYLLDCGGAGQGCPIP